MSKFSNFNSAFSSNNTNEYDYNSVIIKPPDRNITHGTITKTLVIDSRDRDYNKYPHSNKYRVEITEEFRDVTSLELVYGQIPNQNYNINNSNNRFYISENNLLNNIVIPEGKYTNDELLNKLNGKDGNIFNDLKNNYNFSKNKNTLKLRIQSNNLASDQFTFNINYENTSDANPFSSIDKKLGFSNNVYRSEIVDLSYVYVNKNNIVYLDNSENDYKIYKIKATSVTNHNLDFKKIFVTGDYFILDGGNIKYSCRIYKILNENTIEIESLDNNNPIALFGNIFENISILYSSNIYNIEKDDYVILKISEAKLVNSLSTSVNNAYTVIPLYQNTSTIINQSTLPEHGITKYFNPPLGKFFWIDIEFLNYDGSLYDFRGQENMLMFVVSQLNQPGKYNNIIDKW